VWKVIGASVPGSSHLAAGTGCEDAADWAVRPAVTCLAAADGAGSRPLAHEGAKAAVARVLSLVDMPVGDPDEWLREALDEARAAIDELAKTSGTDVDQYATTLAVAVLTEEAIGIAQIGDTIAVVGQAGEFRTVDPAPRFEYANETVFLTASDAMAAVRLFVQPASGVDEVFLSTDGLRLKIVDDLASGTPYQPFFADVAAYVRSPNADAAAVRDFLLNLDDQTGDDKTLVAAVRCS
jgi:hypothetical protein